MTAAIYTGTVRHRRFRERANEFRHRVVYAYLDVERIPAALLRRRGLVRFHRADYLGRRGDLATVARDLVQERTGTRPDGPVRMLTTLRTFGVGFNPISLYWCFDRDETLQAVIAEVTNTPWGERHAYVVDTDDPAATMDKAMHVSPFMPMEQTYVLRAPAPGETASVHVESSADGERAFDATLNLRREPFRARAMLRAPALRNLVLIYAHALALWGVKRVTYFSNPTSKAKAPA
jgi:uncharacterized protein